MAGSDLYLPLTRKILRTALPLAVLFMAAGCGSGGGEAAPVAPQANVADVAEASLPDAQPAFQRQPEALADPGADDEDGSARSAALQPKSVTADPALAGIDLRQLTDDRVVAWRHDATRSGSIAIKSVSQPSSVYTPAQIRAAYRLPILSPLNSALTATGAAAGGAGQTIYVIDAFHHPNAVADLASFDQKFGLPACTQVAAPKVASRLAVASSNSGCTVMVVYSGADGSVVSQAPAYDAGWASEIALDVQWAHATAPYARIVLIEAANASLNALSAAVKLAGTLGPGVVSMSFGAAEGSWVTNANSVFQGTSGMTYVAATGDNGYGTSWPASAPNVLGIGGTSLTYTSAGTRSEAAWSGTGGGLSGYVPLPTYQQNLTVAGVTGALRNRAVADLAFNADPNTGQYVALTAPGGQTRWYAFGGTSLATPQIAGILAVANSQRALKNLPPLGVANTLLYSRFAPRSAAWSNSFNDITSGRNGNCATCASTAGYDIPTGLGTPRGDFFLSYASGS